MTHPRAISFALSIVNCSYRHSEPTLEDVKRQPVFIGNDGSLFEVKKILTDACEKFISYCAIVHEKLDHPLTNLDARGEG